MDPRTGFRTTYGHNGTLRVDWAADSPDVTLTATAPTEAGDRARRYRAEVAAVDLRAALQNAENKATAPMTVGHGGTEHNDQDGLGGTARVWAVTAIFAPGADPYFGVWVGEAAADSTSVDAANGVLVIMPHDDLNALVNLLGHVHATAAAHAFLVHRLAATAPAALLPPPAPAPASPPATPAPTTAPTTVTSDPDPDGGTDPRPPCGVCGQSGWYGSRWHNPVAHAPHHHCHCERPCRACADGDGFRRSSPHQ